MDIFYRPTWVEISLDALRANLLALRTALPDKVKIMAVVKANAYGHGAYEVALEAIAGGAEYLGVAFLDEALELREAGIDAPILVLGYTSSEGLELAVRHNITLTVYHIYQLELMKSLDCSKGKLQVHIKIDTGMGRLGPPTEAESIRLIEEALIMPQVSVEGLYTHYASADEADKSYTYMQHAKFERIVNHFRQKDVGFPLVHAGNSATAFDCPELTFNMVRLGISMYGLYPSEEVNRKRVSLTPVLSFKTNVVMVKTLPPGSGVSYGAAYLTEGEERIATLPVGYADGYTRLLTGKAHVLVRGRRVPIVGRICMDQCMINVTGMPDVRSLDEVVLIGRQGEETISADDLARTLGTINYEITCMISHRVPKVYYRGGKKVKTVNPLVQESFSSHKNMQN